MQRSESIGQLGLALSKAQKAYLPLKKESTNPYYNSKYADLAAVIEATKDALADNELAVTQLPTFEDGKAVVRTLLIHSSGEWLEESLPLALPFTKDKNTGDVFIKDDPQSMSLSITYGRRIAYQSIVGIASDEDDDGNTATGKTVTHNQPPKVNQTPAKPKNAPRPSENVQKTDNKQPELPENVNDDGLPSKEEMTTIKKMVREYSEKTDKEKLVAFIRKTANQKDSNKIPKLVWKTIFQLLATAEKNGNLDKVVEGEQSE